MFCAIATTIDRCKSESMVDIFQVVKVQRMQKPGLVLTAVSNNYTVTLIMLIINYTITILTITTYKHRSSISLCLKLSSHILSHLQCAQANVTHCQPASLCKLTLIRIFNNYLRLFLTANKTNCWLFIKLFFMWNHVLCYFYPHCMFGRLAC